MFPKMIPVLRHPRLALMAAALVAAAPAGAGNTAMAQASATIIEPIAIHADSGLSFGSFARGDTLGSVTVSTAGTVSSAGGVSHTAGTGVAASFTIRGDPGATFRLGATAVTLSDGQGHTMPLGLIGDFDGAGKTSPGLPASGTLSGGSQTLHLGGTLDVGAGQPAGSYSGDIGVEVSYQ